MKVIFRKLIVYLDFLLVRFSAYLILGHSLEMPNTLGRVFMQISLQHTELRLLMMEMVSDL